MIASIGSTDRLVPWHTQNSRERLWRRPAALYRLSVAGYIQHTIDPEPSNISKQRKINLRSVYRAFSESSRMPSASSLLRASSSAQVCMLCDARQ